MSAWGHERRFRAVRGMSAYPLTAAEKQTISNRSFGAGRCCRRRSPTLAPREHKVRAIAAHVMRFLIRKQSANLDKADCGGDNQRQPDKNERQSLITTNRAGQPFERCPASLHCVGVCNHEQEQVELLDHKSEHDNRNAGPHPGEESTFVGGMIAVAPDHEVPHCGLRLSERRGRSHGGVVASVASAFKAAVRAFTTGFASSPTP